MAPPLLPDGQPAPDGLQRHALSAFWPLFVAPRHLIRVAVIRSEKRDVSETELDEILEPLIARTLIEEVPNWRREPRDPHMRPPFDPKPGEKCYAATTTLGRKAVSLLASLARLRTGVWKLGADRLDDQVVLAAGSSPTSAARVDADCACSPTPDVEAALERVIAGGLVERGMRGEISLTADGLVRHTLLQDDLVSAGSVFSTQAVIDTGREGRGALFDARLFHPDIVAASRQRFVDGHLDDAILRGCHRVLDAFRTKTGRTEDGEVLLNLVFNERAPLLRLNALATETERSEQRGFGFLARGMVCSLRNPNAHRTLTHPEIQALESLSLLSLLCRYIDSSST